MNKSITMLIALVVLGLGTPAAAQNFQNYAITQCPLPTFPPGCQVFFWDANGLFLGIDLPVGAACCNPDGVPFNQSCVAPSRSCISPNTPNDICLSCLAAGSPINLASGNTYIAESDISLPGLGGGLRLSRTWNSIFPSLQNTFPTMFGINWRSTYEERLIYNSPDLLLKYARGDGSVWSFGILTASDPIVYQTVAPGNDTTTVTQGVPSHTMLFKSGEKRLFDPNSGLLLSIIDRNGNTTQLAYDSQNRLTTVTDPASRQMTFTYVSSSSNLVSTVTTSTGVSYSYAYDNQGRLVQVTKPDNTTINFLYDNNNRITAVKDSQGKVLESHTYDVTGRGLTSSRANGVDAVTVTYPQ
jgi:YD repeat-containing protein